jgi:hypothetical protein
MRNKSTKTATFIKKLKDFTGEACLYKLSEPIEYDEPWDDKGPPAKKTNYVVVSATITPFSGPETYIFPANKEGEIVDWGELEGSYSGGLSHTKALIGAGYKVN